LFQVAVQSRAWDLYVAVVFKKKIDGMMGTFGLITLNLDGLVDDFLRYSPRFAPVGTPLSGKGLKTALPVLFQLPF
jgi:hypothetical protein